MEGRILICVNGVDASGGNGGFINEIELSCQD